MKPVVGDLYHLNAALPQDPPIPARVVELPDGTRCFAWSAYGDPAIAPLDRFPHAKKLDATVVLPSCPHCSSPHRLPAIPTFTGRPTFICAACKRVSLREDWTP